MGELGRAAEPAVQRVEVAHGRPGPPGRAARRRARPSPWGASPKRLELLGHLGGRLADLVATLLPGPVHAQQHAREPGHAAGVGRREIGAAEERLQVGRQEHRHRPAAVPGHRLHGRHVDLVEVGTLLAVDLDVDEVLVHQGRDLGVLEALALHDVAPVAGRIADRQEDRPVLGPGPGQRLRAPGIPVHRVGRVLEQVRAGLAGQAIGLVSGVDADSDEDEVMGENPLDDKRSISSVPRPHQCHNSATSRARSIWFSSLTPPGIMHYRFRSTPGCWRNNR